MDNLPIFHSWPLYEASERILIGDERELVTAGYWSCDLADERLTWSPAVHRLFGLPEDEPLTRAFAVSRYVSGSRRVMERLRAYAIEHRRGFTMDALILRADNDRRWMRLTALPVLEGRKVVRLTGTKLDVTADYDGTGWNAF